MDEELKKQLTTVLYEGFMQTPHWHSQCMSIFGVTASERWNKLRDILHTDISYTDYMGEIQKLNSGKLVVIKDYKFYFDKSREAYRKWKKANKDERIQKPSNQRGSGNNQS